MLLITDGDWSIQVATLESLDEQADVALVVYGDLGTSGSILLGAPPGKKIFTTGNNDEFRVSVFKYLVTGIGLWIYWDRTMDLLG